MSGIESISTNFLLGGSFAAPIQQHSTQLIGQSFLNSLRAQGTASAQAPASMSGFYGNSVTKAEFSPLSEAYKYLHQQDELLRGVGDKPITTNSANPEIKELAATMNSLFEVQKKLTQFTIGTSLAFAVKDGIVMASQRLSQA